MAWLGNNFTTSNGAVIGQSIYYGLYGVERIGALADRQTLGGVDWFEKGRSFLRSSQQPDGSWHYSLQTDEMNTVWAVLFLTKSTAKSIQRITVRKLGAGTLVGGRTLPKDLTSMTVAGGRIMSRPMNGAVEGMLAVLEDPRSQNADTAVAGLIDRYHREGPEVLRPFKDRFRKMLTDRDPGVRQVAAWALSRTGRSGRGAGPDRRPGRPRGAGGDRRRAGPPAPEPQDRRPGPARALDPRTAQSRPPGSGGPGTRRSARSTRRG